MSSPDEPLAGPVAARVLRTPASGRVIAVFASVFYAELPAGLICVARRGVAPGPLTVVTAHPEKTDWRACLPPGARFVAGPRCLRAGAIALDLTGLRHWRPEPWIPANLQAMATALSRLRAMPLPAEGLAPAVFGREDAALARAAAGPLAEARRWLEGPVSFAGNGPDYCNDPVSASEWAPRLLGLGPGLTPSGDDLLGGMMLALHATGEPARAESLAAALAPHLATTNPISAALLAAAAQGLGAAPLHRAINRLLAGGDPARALDEVAAIGHTSGLDALAGAALVLGTLARPALAA